VLKSYFYSVYAGERFGVIMYLLFKKTILNSWYIIIYSMKSASSLQLLFSYGSCDWSPIPRSRSNPDVFTSSLNRPTFALAMQTTGDLELYRSAQGNRAFSMLFRYIYRLT